jgi:NAD(P)-dependent dehydrogenase (short-subunit alcohol dehydrogenase family)
MRIVIRSLTLLPKVGGLENMMHQLALAWARQGHTVTVITPVPEEAEAQPYTDKFGRKVVCYWSSMDPSGPHNRQGKPPPVWEMRLPGPEYCAVKHW